VQISIKSEPIKSEPKGYEKLPLITSKIIDFHLISVHFSFTCASGMIVDSVAGWVVSKSEYAEKALVFKRLFALARGA